MEGWDKHAPPRGMPYVTVNLDPYRSVDYADTVTYTDSDHTISTGRLSYPGQPSHLGQPSYLEQLSYPGRLPDPETAADHEKVPEPSQGGKFTTAIDEIRKILDLAPQLSETLSWGNDSGPCTVSVSTHELLEIISKGNPGKPVVEEESLIDLCDTSQDIQYTPTTGQSVASSVIVEREEHQHHSSEDVPKPSKNQVIHEHCGCKNIVHGYGALSELEDIKRRVILNTGFPNLLNTGNYSDIDIEAHEGEGKEWKTIKCHKAILSEKTILLGEKFDSFKVLSPEEDRNLTMRLTGYEYKYLWPVISYIYTGSLDYSPHPEFLFEVYRVANLLGVEAVEKHIIREIANEFGEQPLSAAKPLSFKSEYTQFVLKIFNGMANTDALKPFVSVFEAISRREDFDEFLADEMFQNILASNGWISMRLLCGTRGSRLP